MNIDLADYINDLVKNLEDNNLNLTEAFIAYKVINYSNNNGINISNIELINIVNEIYDITLDYPGADNYDQLVEIKLGKLINNK